MDRFLDRFYGLDAHSVKQETSKLDSNSARCRGKQREPLFLLTHYKSVMSGGPECFPQIAHWLLRKALENSYGSSLCKPFHQ